MAFGLDKAFNKFAKAGTAINKTVNQAIGKEVFADIKPIEAPREFPPYSSFPTYPVPEPQQWSPLTGAAKQFTLAGNVISVSSNLDACMQYRRLFQSAADHYAEQFKFKYQTCVQDFYSLIQYFPEMYFEGLMPMIHRAYSLLLPFGVFTANLETFTARHSDTYKIAMTSYETMAGIEASKNQAAERLGDQVGNAVQVRGGGFGLKGATKGMAQAEAINWGMSLLGKFTTHQSKMSPEEKATAFAAFRTDLFFEEVRSDYVNTFLTMVQTLAESGELSGITTAVSTEMDTIYQNLQNPMFPQDKVAPAIVKLISVNPFVPAYFNLLLQKFGQTAEVNQIINYFVV